ncbi:cytochrome b5 domain-containing protein [Arsenicicoccus piscis]|uniref:Cytochrome b5 heme-binding domain-containing protein n=1 Tax=Arsenicicoccus piscis TaxID=673954 RepID=A0ABQ6HKC0_9MICO|nr:cytochrome b5-like heme/steroid binding domain-containing protein [Arsenicicoccus piscis]MCH8627639.1 cytochrome b5 domain-containing protein [Arsenicicoccus piscis]GMA18134.1 hypothetical protein GCM10025862_01550 [Arsenicicoccus piscis]
MRTPTHLLAVSVVGTLLALGTSACSGSSTTAGTTEPAPAGPTTTTSATTTDAATSSPAGTGTTTSTAAGTATSSPTATGTANGTTKSYSMAVVADHNNSSSCWVAIDKTVYDLTKWIGDHPGGPDKIRAICGTDATQAFNTQHANDAVPHQRLAQFKIGTFSG